MASAADWHADTTASFTRRRNGRDRGGDLVAEQDLGRPGSGLGHDPGLVRRLPIRGRVPARVAVQVSEPGHLVGGRVERHLVISQRLAGVLVAQLPAPLPRAVLLCRR